MLIVFYLPNNILGYSQISVLLHKLQKIYSNIRIQSIEHFNNIKEQHIAICCSPPPSFQFQKNSILNIGLTMFEAEHINDHWIQIINNIDRLIVPNNWNKKIFSNNGVNIPIDILNYGIDLNKFKPSNIKYDKFTFLFVGEFIDRKGIYDLINAFCFAFNRNKNVKLLLKPTSKCFKQKIEDFIKNKYYGNVDIKIINQHLKEEDMIQMYQKSHCFVTATKGEGIGLPIYESICCGTPVIIPNLPVFKNIANKCSWKVDILDEKIKPQKNQIVINKAYKDCYFNQINITELSNIMFNAYKKQQDRLKKSQNCLNARKNYALELSINQFEKIFAKYLEK